MLSGTTGATGHLRPAGHTHGSPKMPTFPLVDLLMGNASALTLFFPLTHLFHLYKIQTSGLLGPLLLHLFGVDHRGGRLASYVSDSIPSTTTTARKTSVHPAPQHSD